MAQAEEFARTAPIGPELACRNIWDDDWIRANANRFISRVEVRDRRWHLNDGWSEHLPELETSPGLVVGLPESQVTYIVIATQSQWLEHLRPRMRWGSTAYDKDN